MTIAQKWLLLLASLMGLLSVAMGAFGAHALKNKLDPQMLSLFEVGARYQMYHAFAIPLSVWVSSFLSNFFVPLSGWLFFSGSLLFSGSLYLLALTGVRILGAITPIGGVILLLGWLCLAISIFLK